MNMPRLRILAVAALALALAAPAAASADAPPATPADTQALIQQLAQQSAALRSQAREQRNAEVAAQAQALTDAAAKLQAAALQQMQTMIVLTVMRMQGLPTTALTAALGQQRTATQTAATNLGTAIGKLQGAAVPTDAAKALKDQVASIQATLANFMAAQKL
jgi:hypothetical protein